MKTAGASPAPFLSREDLRECDEASSFGARLEAAKRASTLAIERVVQRGLTRESCQCAEVLFKFGETQAERDRGLRLLYQHLLCGNAEVVKVAAKTIKRTRRTSVAASSIGEALSDVRRERVAAATKVS